MSRKNKTEKTTGVYQAAGRSFGFVTPETAGDLLGDYFIPPRQENGAWDGDTVAIEPVGDPTGGGERRTARVTAILVRKNRTVIGVLRRQGREVWLVPEGEKLRQPILVTGKTAGARAGDKAAVSVASYGTAKQPPMGALAEVFGRDGSLDAAVEAILYDQKIERDFPKAAEEQARRAPQAVCAADLTGRLDLREKCIITIDGASAKDLDDAVSVETDAQGRTVLGVHIADVSHYVPMGSALDEEAWSRGTSVYFPGEVVPMLPVELSNGICSLNPQVDRLTLSCIMTMNPDGSVAEYTIQKSVIRTAERMTYRDCNALLKGEDGDLARRYAPIVPMLREMSRLAKVLERRRRLRGSLALESREREILCSQTGQPVEVRMRAPGESEGIIESFMLAANECVAEHLANLRAPAVYRIHEKPGEEKAQALRTLLSPLGYGFREPDNFSLQKILDQAAGRPEEFLVHTAVLRAMMKARYEPQNVGHFGLAARYYCHFTSPIRRYPDLMIHRCLTALLEEGAEGKTARRLSGAAAKAARQSSERELAAQTAEREIEKCYLAAYMAGRIGETFSAVVSGVARLGLFVLTDDGVEGFLPVGALPGGGYQFDEERMTLTGSQSGVCYTLGTPVEVVCGSAEPGSGRVDFQLPGGVPIAAPPAEKRPKLAERRVGKKPGRRSSHPPRQNRGRRKK